MSKQTKDIKKLLPTIPVDIIENISTQLLTKWEQTKRITLLFQDTSPKKYPDKLFFGVLALDWMGLAEATTAAITDMEWNIETSWGTVISYNEDELALMVFGVRVSDESQFRLYLSKEEELRGKLLKLCYKGWRKRLLITQGSKKIEKFEEVMGLVKQWGKLDSDIAGAITKFFNSREEEYLAHRSAEHLASLILSDYEFLQSVRGAGGKPCVEASHFLLDDAKLTGISIAAFDRDFSLGLALEAIRTVVSNYDIFYNKEYITYDGIAVYRIELIGYHPIKSLESAILNRIISKKFNALKAIESYGGFEHYAKAIIPQLIKEFTATQVPQLYLSPVFVSPEFIQFKLIVVKAPSTKEWIEQYIDELEKHKEITIVAHGVPTMYRNLEVNIFDLRAAAGKGDIYSIIKESLLNKLGKYRDFDEGLRRVDAKKLEDLKQYFRGTPRGFLREFYYAIEDFYRISAPAVELAKVIETGIKLAKNPGIEITVFDENRFLIGMASKSKILSQALSILQGYKVVTSKLQVEEFEILLLKAEKQENSLNPGEIDSLKEALSKILD